MFYDAGTSSDHCAHSFRSIINPSTRRVALPNDAIEAQLATAD
ncbi:hypothetical protein ABIA00_003598 [Bradyrhizobium ottawaense]